MRGGIRLGAVWGIPLFVDPWWVFILMAFTWDYGRGYRALTSQPLLFGFLVAIGLFGSLLGHELAHSLTAKRCGANVQAISLFPLRAVTSIEGEFPKPGTLFQVAIAGPLCNLAIGVLLLWGAAWFSDGSIFTLSRNVKPEEWQTALTNLAQTIGAARTLFSLMAWQVAQANLLLALINLIPGLPMDGGHALKAAVWKITGDRLAGVRWSAGTGQTFGLLLLLLGLTLFVLGAIGGLLFALMGFFITSSALANLQTAKLQHALYTVTAEAAMTRNFRLLDADMSLRQFTDEYLVLSESSHHGTLFYATANGRDRGLVNPDKLRSIDRREWDRTPLSTLVIPTAELVSVQLTDLLATVLHKLEQTKLNYLTVLSPVGSIAGVIDRGDLLRALARKLQWHIPEETIAQVKRDGKFPPNLPLVEWLTSLEDTPKP
ncbi:MAG: site-2 protease family protein [Pseudanabaenaceae cyanobacterium]